MNLLNAIRRRWRPIHGAALDRPGGSPAGLRAFSVEYVFGNLT
jgi:hypothetical protein